MLKPKGTMLELTDNAIKRLTYIANKAGTRYVRLDIKGGGCAGFEYKWSTTDEREDTDCLLGNVLVVSLELELYLLGTTLDWVEGEFNSEFKITNPNSKSSCGCGESFSV
jgi:iron-sulfur cluster assembly accessory protein